MKSEEASSRLLSRRAFLQTFRGRFSADGLISGGLATEEVQPETPEDRLRAIGVKVVPLAGNTSLLQVSCKHVSNTFGDKQMQLLEPLAGRVAWMNLGSTGITNAGLEVVARMENLTRLYLQDTRVSDEGMVHLRTLSELAYLNLYNTEVGDGGLQHLHGLEKLRTLFVWQSRVTPEGAEALQTALPDLQVSLGETF